jgi:hypothetical protein
VVVRFKGASIGEGRTMSAGITRVGMAVASSGGMAGYLFAEDFGRLLVFATDFLYHLLVCVIYIELLCFCKFLHYNDFHRF